MLSKEERKLYIKTINEYYNNSMDIEDVENILDNHTKIWYNCTNMTQVAICILEENGLLDGLDDNLKEYFDYEEYGNNLQETEVFVFTEDGNCIEIDY